MTIETYPDSQRVNDSIQVSVKNDLNELYTAVQSLSAGSGVVISSADTPGYLEDKLLAGTGITLTKATTGSGQTLTASTPFDVVSNEASLGTGSVDGEMRICADSGNRYRWSATYAKWSIVGVNIYSSAPSSTTYHIPTGTVAVISEELKKWSGTSWADAVSVVASVQQTVYNIITAASIYANPAHWTDVANWNITITPKRASSIIRVTFDIHGFNAGAYGHYKVVYNVGGGSYADSPLLGDAAGSRTRCAVRIHNNTNMSGLVFAHQPTYTVGQALNYKLQIGTSGTMNFCFNRSDTDTDSASYGRGASMIMAEELAV